MLLHQIPADVRIIECSDNMVVDNAPLTGESEPQKRKNFCTNDEPMETQVSLFLFFFFFFFFLVGCRYFGRIMISGTTVRRYLGGTRGRFSDLSHP